MKVHNQEKNILKGTLILTFAALLIKILSAFYRIPFQKIVGISVFIYTSKYPFYGIAVALSTYGFPVVISKLYTEEMAKGEQRNVKQLLLYPRFSYQPLVFSVLPCSMEERDG